MAAVVRVLKSEPKKHRCYSEGGSLITGIHLWWWNMISLSLGRTSCLIAGLISIYGTVPTESAFLLWRKETIMRHTYPQKFQTHFVLAILSTVFEASGWVLASINVKTSMVRAMLGPSDFQCGKKWSCDHSSPKAARPQSFESKFHWTVPKHHLWLRLDLGSIILYMRYTYSIYTQNILQIICFFFTVCYTNRTCILQIVYIYTHVFYSMRMTKYTMTSILTHWTGTHIYMTKKWLIQPGLLFSKLDSMCMIPSFHRDIVLSSAESSFTFPNFCFRAARLVGTRKLPCRAPFSQMLSPKWEAQEKSRSDSTRFCLVLPCETFMVGFKASVSQIDTNRMASQWEAESSLFLSKRSDLPSSYFIPIVIVQQDFGSAKDARQEPICCLLEVSQYGSLTHGHMNLSAANLLFQVYDFSLPWFHWM